MTLPENYADGGIVHDTDLNAWTDAINANTQQLETLATDVSALETSVSNLTTDALMKDTNGKLALDQIDASGTATSSTYLRGDGSWQTPPSNSVGGVQIVTAPTGVAATDTANIQAAINAAPATGGDVQLQAGTYALTAGGLTISNPIRLRGVGNTPNIDVPTTPPGYTWMTSGFTHGSTTLQSSSATATAITCTANGVAIENLRLYNNVPYSGAGSPTAGYGIQTTYTTTYLHRLLIDNFYDDVRIADHQQACAVRDCWIMNPVRYGLFYASPNHPDEGDSVIAGNWFLSDHTPTSAIRWESGGGFRVCQNKFNGVFTTGVDIAVANGVTTADIFIHDNSIEANTGTGTGIKFARQAGSTGTVILIMVTGNQFMYKATCIDWGAGFTSGRIEGNIGYYCTTGITLQNGCGAYSIGDNIWQSTTTPINIVAGASTDAVIDPQHVVGGATLYDKPTIVGVPASATATGVAGQIAYSSTYLYMCTATNTWRRVAIASW